jgi:hypothetical protein
MGSGKSGKVVPPGAVISTLGLFTAIEGALVAGGMYGHLSMASLNKKCSTFLLVVCKIIGKRRERGDK